MNWGAGIPKYSLTAIDKERYLETYSRLKLTYAAKLKEVWTEKTDPDKFIHEDLGIASYLITLWETERLKTLKSPNFVDMGCGNGLLTYLLTCEGFSGFGFDVRERKIWKCFDPKPTLKVCAFRPTDDQLFSACDRNTWLIGNHPDELTPWIPVLSRRLNCSFFIIPCCSYDFTGKFKREENKIKGGTSIYSTYLQFMKSLAEQCGYAVLFDRMRIPSTKRTCLIGSLDSEKFADANEQQKSLEFCLSKIVSCQSETFQPRPAIEPVKNCTKIDSHVISDTVNLLFKYLLSEAVLARVAKDGALIPESMYDTDTSEFVLWNTGKQDLLIKDAVTVVPPDYLKHMKAQHGGFQTLVRNHGHIFVIQEGFIRLRVPSIYDTKGRKFESRPKTRRCYFFDNHPQGCPLDGDNCRFSHKRE